MKPEIEFRPKSSGGIQTRRAKATSRPDIHPQEKTADEAAPPLALSVQSVEPSQVIIDKIADQLPPADAKAFKEFVTSAHRRAQVRIAVAKHRANKKVITGNQDVITGNQQTSEA